MTGPPRTPPGSEALPEPPPAPPGPLADPPPGALPRRLARRCAHRLDGADPGVRHAVRRLLTVACLLPLLVLLAVRAPLLPAAPLLLGYGFLVLSVTVVLLYLAYAHYDDPAERPLRRRPPERALRRFPPLPARPRVSFLVAVKDEEAHIAACVRAMAASDYPDLQLLVVDDGSTDRTPAILADLAAELPVTVVRLERNVGKKRALVRAAELADGEVLAFTDSDCLLAPDALARCVTALVRHPELGAVSGHARALNPGASVLARTQDVWYEGQFRVAKAAESVFGGVTCVSGPLAVFRREAIWDHLPAWAEDRFLGREFRFATDRQLTGYVLGQCALARRRDRRDRRDRHDRRASRRAPGAPVAPGPEVAVGAAVDGAAGSAGTAPGGGEPAPGPGTDAAAPGRFGDRYPPLPWRTGYVRSARVWTTVPARLRPFLRQQVRWKKSFVRNIFFTGGFMWRRGLGSAALYYGRVLWVLFAPVMAVRHLLLAPLTGLGLLTALYLSGVVLKGAVWGVAFRVDNPGSPHWRYRPLMSLLSATVLSWLLPYALATIRRNTWSRSAS